MQDYNVPSKVAGVLEEYGKDRPSTSKTELMVLALSDRRVDVVPIPSVGENARVHPAAGSGAGTSMSNDIDALFLRDFTNSKCALESYIRVRVSQSHEVSR